MKRIVLLLAALVLPGMAAAASGHADAAAHATANATVAFYRGFPGAGGTFLAKVNAGSDAASSGPDVLAHADSVVVTVSGHAYTFALDQAARARGQLELDVEGALKASARGEAKIAAVVQELARAQDGQQTLVVLSRTEGKGHVVVALYHPDGGNAGLRVHNADHATVWTGGRAHGYTVGASGTGGLLPGLTLTGPDGTQALASVVAGLQTKSALRAGTTTGATAQTRTGLGVTLGGSN